MKIKDRLKQVFEAKSLKLVTVCEISGIPYSTMQNYLRDVREPTVENLIKLSTHLNINLHWLLTGQGEMFVSTETGEYLTPSEQSLLEDYRESNEQGKEAIEKTAKALASKEASKNRQVAA